MWVEGGVGNDSFHKREVLTMYMIPEILYLTVFDFVFLKLAELLGVLVVVVMDHFSVIV